MSTCFPEGGKSLGRLHLVHLTLVFSSLACQATAQENTYFAQRGLFGRRYQPAQAPAAAAAPRVPSAPAPVAAPVAAVPAPKPTARPTDYLAKLRRPSDLPTLPKLPQVEKRPKKESSTTREPRIPIQDVPDLAGSCWSSAAGGKNHLLRGGVLHHSCKYCTTRGTWEQHGKVVVTRIGKNTTIRLVEGNSMRCKNQLGNVWTEYRID